MASSFVGPASPVGVHRRWSPPLERDVSRTGSPLPPVPGWGPTGPGRCAVGDGSATRVDLLGPLQVTRDGHPVGPAGSRRRSLLAVLALRPGEVVTVDQIVDALWGEDVPASALNVVQTYVSAWRKALEPDRAARSTQGLLETVGPGYRLHLSPDSSDLLRFTELAEQGRAAGRLGPARCGRRGPRPGARAVARGAARRPHRRAVPPGRGPAPGRPPARRARGLGRGRPAVGGADRPRPGRRGAGAGAGRRAVARAPHRARDVGRLPAGSPPDGARALRGDAPVPGRRARCGSRAGAARDAPAGPAPGPRPGTGPGRAVGTSSAPGLVRRPRPRGRRGPGPAGVAPPGHPDRSRRLREDPAGAGGRGTPWRRRRRGRAGRPAGRLPGGRGDRGADRAQRGGPAGRAADRALAAGGAAGPGQPRAPARRRRHRRPAGGRHRPPAGARDLARGAGRPGRAAAPRPPARRAGRGRAGRRGARGLGRVAAAGGPGAGRRPDLRRHRRQRRRPGRRGPAARRAPAGAGDRGPVAAAADRVRPAGPAGPRARRPRPPARRRGPAPEPARDGGVEPRPAGRPTSSACSRGCRCSVGTAGWTPSRRSAARGPTSRSSTCSSTSSTGTWCSSRRRWRAVRGSGCSGPSGTSRPSAWTPRASDRRWRSSTPGGSRPGPPGSPRTARVRTRTPGSPRPLAEADDLRAAIDHLDAGGTDGRAAAARRRRDGAVVRGGHEREGERRLDEALARRRRTRRPARSPSRTSPGCGDRTTAPVPRGTRRRRPVWPGPAGTSRSRRSPCRRWGTTRTTGTAAGGGHAAGDRGRRSARRDPGGQVRTDRVGRGGLRGRLQPGGAVGEPVRCRGRWSGSGRRSSWPSGRATGGSRR